MADDFKSYINSFKTAFNGFSKSINAATDSFKKLNQSIGMLLKTLKKSPTGGGSKSGSTRSEAKFEKATEKIEKSASEFKSATRNISKFVDRLRTSAGKTGAEKTIRLSAEEKAKKAEEVKARASENKAKKEAEEAAKKAAKQAEKDAEAAAKRKQRDDDRQRKRAENREDFIFKEDFKNKNYEAKEAKKDQKQKAQQDKKDADYLRNKKDRDEQTQRREELFNLRQDRKNIDFDRQHALRVAEQRRREDKQTSNLGKKLNFDYAKLRFADMKQSQVYEIQKRNAEIAERKQLYREKKANERKKAKEDQQGIGLFGIKSLKEVGPRFQKGFSPEGYGKAGESLFGGAGGATFGSAIGFFVEGLISATSTLLKFGTAILTLVPGFVRAFSPGIASQLDRAFLDLKAVIGQALLPVFNSLVVLTRAFADSLIKIFRSNSTTFAKLSEIIIRVGVPVLNTFLQVIERLVQVIGQNATSIGAFLQTFATTVGSLIVNLVELGVALLPLINLVLKLVNFAMPALIKAMLVLGVYITARVIGGFFRFVSSVDAASTALQQLAASAGKASAAESAGGIGADIIAGGGKGKGKGGKFAGFGKAVKGNALAALLFGGVDFAQRKAAGEGTGQAALGAGASTAGSVIGGVALGAVGTAIGGPIGTAIGSALGSVIGGTIGSALVAKKEPEKPLDLTGQSLGAGGRGATISTFEKLSESLLEGAFGAGNDVLNNIDKNGRQQIELLRELVGKEGANAPNANPNGQAFQGVNEARFAAARVG